VETDTFQMLNHQVSPSYRALQCTDCHGGTQRIDLAGLGYALKGSEATVCSQCHGQKSVGDFASVHRRHVDNERIECSTCHNFSRPERGLGGAKIDGLREVHHNPTSKIQKGGPEMDRPFVYRFMVYRPVFQE
jgi:hypothetical protein